MNEDGSTKLKSLERALHLIDALENAGRPLSVNELGKLLNTNRTTLYATLNTLVAHNYIEKNEDTNKYNIGLRMIEIGLNYRNKFSFSNLAEIHSRKLSQKWHTQVNVGLFKDPDQVIILFSHLPSNKETNISNIFFSINNNYPAYATSLGKAFLLDMNDEELKLSISRMTLKKYTKYTIVDDAELFNHIKELHHLGYSYDNFEYVDTIRCVGVGIKDYNSKTVASISIMIDANCHDEERELMINDLILVGDMISYNLGYRK